MEISDIVNGITVKLDEVFQDVNIYVEAVPQRFTTPAILVQFLDFDHVQQIGKAWKVTPRFNIQYFARDGSIECYDACLKIQQGLDDITLLNGVPMLARGARTEVIKGEGGDVIGNNFMRFDFFLRSVPEFIPMLSLQQWVNNERVNNIG
jgi:hypothetical protein